MINYKIVYFKKPCNSNFLIDAIQEVNPTFYSVIIALIYFHIPALQPLRILPLNLLRLRQNILCILNFKILSLWMPK